MSLPMSYWKQVPYRALVMAETEGGMIAGLGSRADLAACPICVSFVLSIHVSMPACAYPEMVTRGILCPGAM